MSRVVLFAGPSLNSNARDLVKDSGIDWHQPCQRLDIRRLLEAGNHDCLIIADGFFHQVNAIGHREIRDAIDRGLVVWGLSSIGAIRAYELRHHGMRGYGKVYDRFYQEDDLQDDEIALLHGPAPRYFRFSEPLIHLRCCIEDLTQKKLINKEEAKLVICQLKERYFGERTLALFAKTMKEITGYRVDEIIADFDRYRQKEIDLVNFLQQKVWLND
jgi:hypothetical protein